MSWRKILLWLLEHAIRLAFQLNRHFTIRDNKIYFECPEPSDQDPDVVFDLEAFYDAYFEEDNT